jgi:D-glycero-alpha-D-manno-heptose-7-phosphate kinase
MIISKTPLRVSFAGGGTDIADCYRTGYGAVVSSAIRKYVYVTVNKRFDDDIRISYAKTEIVDSVDKIKHGLVREALRKVGIRNDIEITTIADIPSRGTGLGSSSAIAVGLLNALYAFKGYRASRALPSNAVGAKVAVNGVLEKARVS